MASLLVIQTPERTAFFIHSRIHMACPQAKCILHTHMRYATAVTMIEGGRLEPVVQSALKFFGQIAYMDDFGGLALDEDEGDRLARALGEKRILFLANHGVIVVGPSVAHAFNDLYYLEKACMAQITAMSSGRPLKRIPQQVAEYTHAQMQGDRDDQSLEAFHGNPPYPGQRGSLITRPKSFCDEGRSTRTRLVPVEPLLYFERQE